MFRTYLELYLSSLYYLTHFYFNVKSNTIMKRV